MHRTNAKELNKLWNNIRDWVKEHNLTVVTTTQPARPDCGAGLSPEELERIARQPIVIDYVGIMRPEPSRSMVPISEGVNI